MKKYPAIAATVKNLLFAFLLFTIFLSTENVSGQTYYSRLSNASDSSGVTNTGGCSPDIQNPLAFADKDRNNVSFFAANTSSQYNCTAKYKFTTYLNLPATVKFVEPGSQAGFMITVPTSISHDSLGKYIVINTYLDNAIAEIANKSKLYALDEGQDNIDWLIFFNTTKPFNKIELVVDSKIIQLNNNFEFDVAYAQAQKSIVLPVGIFNFKANVNNNNVDLSWQSTAETNLKNYTIERSNNGISYLPVTTLNAKGNSGTGTTYQYTDKELVNGNYLYRIVSADKDGTLNTSNSIKATIASQNNLSVYPNLLKAGENINIQISSTGTTLINMYNAQGQLVKQMRINAAGKYSVNTSGLSAGLYNIQITLNGTISKYKVIIN